MTDYNIHLLDTVIHKFSGSQIRAGNETQVFAQQESVPEQSIVDVSIRSTFFISRQGRYLQTHFQIDDVRLPEDEIPIGYRLQFCLLAVFEVKDTESKDMVEKFAQTCLPNILAPIASDNHGRFVSLLQPGIGIARLQPYIPAEAICDFIEQNKITFNVVTEPTSHNS